MLKVTIAAGKQNSCCNGITFSILLWSEGGKRIRIFWRAMRTPPSHLLWISLPWGLKWDLTQKFGHHWSWVKKCPFWSRLFWPLYPCNFFVLPSHGKCKPVIFFGGGFLGESTKVLENQCKFLWEQSKTTVISLDYTDAVPEIRSPALNDRATKGLSLGSGTMRKRWNLDRLKITAAQRKCRQQSCFQFHAPFWNRKKLRWPCASCTVALDLSYAEDTDYWTIINMKSPEHYNHAIPQDSTTSV